MEEHGTDQIVVDLVNGHSTPHPSQSESALFSCARNKGQATSNHLEMKLQASPRKECPSEDFAAHSIANDNNCLLSETNACFDFAKGLRAELPMLSASVHSIDSQVKMLTGIVLQQSQTIANMNTILNHLLTTGSPIAGKRDVLRSVTTPTSSPPPSKIIEDQDQLQNPKTWRSTRISKRASCSHQEDPTYTPTVILTSHSSDHQAFRRRRKKKRSSENSTRLGTTTDLENVNLKKDLFSAKQNKSHQRKDYHDPGLSMALTYSLDYIHTPYGFPSVYSMPGLPLMDSHELPSWMALSFRPTNDMRLVGVELALAAYIFGLDYDPKEVLVTSHHCNGNREALMTITPGRPLIDDVLILVASMLSHGGMEQKWFLPTTFTQIVLGNTAVSDGTLKRIRKDFMGKVDKLLKIYAPIWCDNHWFLLIVDLMKMELLYLDSKKSDDHRRSRILAIKKVALFLDEFLQDESFYQDPTRTRPSISEYKVFEPRVNQQEDGSNDCGVWVCQWMILHHLWTSYELEKVNEYTRMRLAIDLVLKGHNSINSAIIRKAIESWNRKATAHGHRL